MLSINNSEYQINFWHFYNLNLSCFSEAGKNDFIYFYSFNFFSGNYEFLSKLDIAANAFLSQPM